MLQYTKVTLLCKVFGVCRHTMLKVWLTCVNHFDVLQILCTFALAEDNGQRRGATRERRQRLKAQKVSGTWETSRAAFLFSAFLNRHSGESLQMSPLF